MVGTFLVDLLISSISSGVSKTLTAPVERVKLLLQLQDASAQVRSRYTGILNCIVRVVREQGVLSFWRGNLSNVVRYVPSTAFAFATKDWFKRTFCFSDPGKEPYKFYIGNIVSGGVGGAAASILTYPLDFTRTRLAVDIGKHPSDRLYHGAVDCMRKVLQSDGWTGLYRGASLALPVFILYRSLYFGLYDSWTYQYHLKHGRITNIEKLLIAGVVTTVASLVLYPCDTVRRRMMMQSGRKDLLYAGVRDCVRKIYAQEGGNGFFKGGLVNLLRSSGGAFGLVLYDVLKQNTHYISLWLARICTGLPAPAVFWTTVSLQRTVLLLLPRPAE